MRAAWFERFGGAREVLVLGSQPTPRPASGEVLVRIVSSGVNPSDVKKRAGSLPNLLDDGFVIPHSDGAGIIESVGEGVQDRQVGDRVWIYQAQYGRRFGAAAEFVAIDASRAPLLPTNTDYNVGACLGIPAMTAHRIVFSDGPVKDQNILITGGAGRVGFYAIQWAAQAGANVIATASNDADTQACIEAGAFACVNHRIDDWAQDAIVVNNKQKFDRVLDVEFGANLPHVLQLVQPSATIVTYSSTVVPEPRLPFFQMMYQDLTVQFVIVYAMPEAAKQHAILDIEQCLHEERLQHRIAGQFALADIAAAHEMVEAGTCRGSVVVTTS